MSENLDHEVGGTFASGDLITEQCANTKFITIQSSNPSPIYDGQVFIDTDDNPPLIRVYDLTNTQWMTRPRNPYQSTHFINPEISLANNGALVVQYNGTKTVLLARTNGEWWGAQKT